MHDEVLELFDDCIADLLILRTELAVARRVRPGERRVKVLRAVRSAERFTELASRLIEEPAPDAVESRLPVPTT
jgi:hypothetical protein